MRTRGRKDQSSDSEEETDENVRQVAQGSVFMNQGHSVEFMMVTPDEKLYTCEGDGCVRVYDLDVRSLHHSHCLWIAESEVPPLVRAIQTGELDSQSKPIQARSLRLEPQAIFVNTRANTIIAWSTTVWRYPPLQRGVVTISITHGDVFAEHELLHHIRRPQEVDHRLFHRGRCPLHSLCRRNGDLVGRHNGASSIEEPLQVLRGLLPLTASCSW